MGYIEMSHSSLSIVELYWVMISQLFPKLFDLSRWQLSKYPTGYEPHLSGFFRLLLWPLGMSGEVSHGNPGKSPEKSQLKNIIFCGMFSC